MRRFLFRAAIVLTAGALVISGTYLTTTLLTATPLAEGCTVQVDGGETELEVSQAENASLIAALAVRQDYPRRAAIVALAAAYQESGLRNLDHGDRDSLGLFQQRPSQGWGTRAQIGDPYYSTQKFYDHLMDVENYQRLSVAQAAQLVQRSADGNAYAQHERNAQALTDAFTGRSEASFSCRLTTTPKPSAVAAGIASGPTRGADAGDGSDAGQDGSDRDPAGDRPELAGAGASGADRAPGSDAPGSDGAAGADDDRGPVDGSGERNGPDMSDASDGTDASDGRKDPGTDSGPGAAERQGPDSAEDPLLAARDDAGEAERPRSAAEAVQRELEHAFGSGGGERRGDGSDRSADQQPDEPVGERPDDETGGGTVDPGGVPENGPVTGQDGPVGPVAPQDEPSAADEPSEGAVSDRIGPDPGDGGPSGEPVADARVVGDGDQVRVTVDDQQVGWAIAHWSVANTQRLGITEVGYDGRSWTAADSADGWKRAPGSPAGTRTVHISLG